MLHASRIHIPTKKQKNKPMTPREFKKTYWPDIEAVCRETGLNPLFVAAQAALETGWGESAIGNNLFGITAGVIRRFHLLTQHGSKRE